MLPFNWIQDFGYYITYFGDVYYGIAIIKDSSKGDFYIIGKNKWIEYTQFQPGIIPPDDLEKIGVYIPTREIIEHWIKTIPTANDDYTITWNGIASDYKKMYVFGAGASTNCLFGVGKDIIKKSTYRPPLGNELFASRFDSIIKKYPGLKHILPKFESNGNNIETILEEDWLELMASRNIELAAQHIQLQFFLQELFELISKTITEQHFRYSLPTLFVQKLFLGKQNGVKPLIVSFNYDTILDSAIEEQLNISFTDLNQYMNPKIKSPFLFFKPHGSWNWGWEFDNSKLNGAGNDIANILYQSKVSPARVYYNLLGKNMLISDGWGLEARNHPHFIGKITPNKNKIKMVKNGAYYFPALLLPYRDKDEFVMPHAHQLQMEFVMPHIEEMVLIGWKGNEKLFNLKLQAHVKALKRIVIVNPDSDAVKEELSKYLDLNMIEIVCVKYYDDYVLNHMNG